MSHRADTIARTTVRMAQERDISAILSLVLTSFRQFPLFAYLYSPLDRNKELARDTVFFWRRRILLELLDPASAVIVAEVSDHANLVHDLPSDAQDSVDIESQKMLKWVVQNPRLAQTSKNKAGMTIVGFAIWKDRPGTSAAPNDNREVPKPNWICRLRSTLLKLEMAFWSIVYQRRDIDPVRYRAYNEAEESLETRFYKERCYYLDNLCVDFRCQRLGIGQLLLSWGIEVARQKSLSVSTEAGIKAVGLYQKMGFEKIGIWEIADFEIPVMRLSSP